MKKFFITILTICLSCSFLLSCSHDNKMIADKITYLSSSNKKAICTSIYIHSISNVYITTSSDDSGILKDITNEYISSDKKYEYFTSFDKIQTFTIGEDCPFKYDQIIYKNDSTYTSDNYLSNNQTYNTANSNFNNLKNPSRYKKMISQIIRPSIGTYSLEFNRYVFIKIKYKYIEKISVKFTNEQNLITIFQPTFNTDITSYEIVWDTISIPSSNILTIEY